MSDAVKPRAYKSPLRERRAAETRAAILDAAAHLFTTDGYVRTRLSDVAVAAGVSPATVKLIFGTKPELLLALWHRTLAGGVDDQPPVANRPWYTAILETPDPADKLRQLAHASTAIKARIAPLSQVIETAAAIDDELATLQSTMAHEFHANQRRIIEHLATGGHLRPDLTIAEATDLLWTLNSTRVYSMLVHDRSWPPAKYEQWLATALQRELLG